MTVVGHGGFQETFRGWMSSEWRAYASLKELWGEFGRLMLGLHTHYCALNMVHFDTLSISRSSDELQ